MHLSHAQRPLLTGRSFFPRLISPPFRNGLHEAFAFAIVACLVAAVASWSRGGNPTASGQPGEPSPGRRSRVREQPRTGAPVAR